MSSSEEEDNRSKKRIKTNLDEQRLKIEKLMANPNKEVFIPETVDESKKPRAFNTHEFVRNVMGASAGAGSGEFDIYRGCRRRELIRQEYLQKEDDKKKSKEEFDKVYQGHIDEAEKKTAKKREKRLKAKQKLKGKKASQKNQKNNEKEASGSEMEQEPEEIDLTEKVEESSAEKKIDETKSDQNLTAEPVSA